MMIIVVVLLALLLVLLAAWQRRLDGDLHKKTVEQLRESRHRGTDKALAQYPQIKPFLCIGCGSCIAACPEEGVIGLVDGIAHIINGSRCVGHARCQSACPVGAITVGLGDLASRPDIPILSAELETRIPGIFIAGELSGMALIRHAIDQGTRVIDTIAQRLEKKPRGDSALLDVVIVGAGPAGLAACLRATERKLSFQAFCQDDIGGTIRKYPRRKLTLVQSVSVPLFGSLPGGEYTKEELVNFWVKLVKDHQVSVQTQTALQSITRETDSFLIQTSAGTLRSRIVLLALGRRGTPRKLAVPGEDREKVLYQLMDASTYNAQKILVVGGGDSAIEAATALANQRGNDVILSYRKENFSRLKTRNQERIRDYAQAGKVKVMFSSEVQAIDDQSVTLSLQKGAALSPCRFANDYVFIFAGGEPPYPLLEKIGIRFGGTGSYQ